MKVGTLSFTRHEGQFTNNLSLLLLLLLLIGLAIIIAIFVTIIFVFIVIVCTLVFWPLRADLTCSAIIPDLVVRELVSPSVR